MSVEILILQILATLLRLFEQRLVSEAERKQSGKLDAIQASIDILKNPKSTPEERRNAALALQAARKS